MVSERETDKRLRDILAKVVSQSVVPTEPEEQLENSLSEDEVQRILGKVRDKLAASGEASHETSSTNQASD